MMALRRKSRSTIPHFIIFIVLNIQLSSSLPSIHRFARNAQHISPPYSQYYDQNQINTGTTNDQAIVPQNVQPSIIQQAIDIDDHDDNDDPPTQPSYDPPPLATTTLAPPVAPSPPPTISRPSPAQVTYSQAAARQTLPQSYPAVSSIRYYQLPSQTPVQSLSAPLHSNFAPTSQVRSHSGIAFQRQTLASTQAQAVPSQSSAQNIPAPLYSNYAPTSQVQSQNAISPAFQGQPPSYSTAAQSVPVQSFAPAAPSYYQPSYAPSASQPTLQSQVSTFSQPTQTITFHAATPSQPQYNYGNVQTQQTAQVQSTYGQQIPAFVPQQQQPDIQPQTSVPALPNSYSAAPTPTAQLTQHPQYYANQPSNQVGQTLQNSQPIASNAHYTNNNHRQYQQQSNNVQQATFAQTQSVQQNGQLQQPVTNIPPSGYFDDDDDSFQTGYGK